MTSNDMCLLSWDLETLSIALDEKKISPVEVTKNVLDQIESKNGQINAFITVNDKEALTVAREAEKEIMRGNRKGHLHGIPIGLKDLIKTSNMRTTMGSQLYQSFIPVNDATVVTKLQEAGAIMIGKLNTHEFAYGTTGDTSYFGPVRNPYDLTKITGGSSSGSAAALATNMCYGALGTDTGGSIRIPASFCGVVGMKPTFGSVSKWGVYPLAPTLDHVGPMTKTVKDNAIMLNSLIGYDSKDLYSIKRKQEDFTSKLHNPIQGVVIGIPSSFFNEGINSEIQKRIDEVISVYEKLGATICRVEISHLEDLSWAHRIILRAEAFATHKDKLKADKKDWDSEVKNRLGPGQEIRAYDYFQASEIKKQGLKNFKEVFQNVDVILSPVTSELPTNLYEREIDNGKEKVDIYSVLNKLTGISNITGLPSLAIPCGLSSKGLPIGFELTGRPYDESNLYRIAYAYEQAAIKSGNR